MMNGIRNSSIGTKIYTIVLLLAGVAVVVGGIGVYALRIYQQQISAIDMAARRAVVGERVNGLINAVVMDSRGVYMARDRAEAERFGAPLLASLTRIEALMAEWRNLIEPRQETAFARAEKNAKDFVTFRKELVRRGVEIGGPASREFGDNEANRSNRQAFNKEISDLADQNNVEIASMRADLDTFNEHVVLMVAIGGGVGILVGLLMSILIVRRAILRPIKAIIAVMTRLAEGDKQVEIPALDQSDEIGEMARAVDVFKANSLRNEEMEQARRIEHEQRDAERLRLDSLTKSFGSQIDDVVKTLSTAAADMHQSATAMSTVADRTSGSASLVASASDQASSNVQTVATAAEELTASIAEIARQVAQSASFAGEAVAQADRTNEMVQGLSNAADRIGEVVKLITAIASQTNLLALNATIEAARAGEAGRGFAVVASEVKSLATQTGKATEEITHQIAEIQTATRNSVEAINAIGATIRQINDTAAGIAAAVEQQGAATSEIARNVQQAAESAQSVATNITDVTRGASETGGAASHVLKAAAALTSQSDRLRGQVDGFVKQVVAG